MRQSSATLSTALFSLIWGIPADALELWNNGPLSTGPVSKSGVAAPAGTTWSEVQNDAGNLTQSNYYLGVSSQQGGPTGGPRLGDDFTVPAGETWTIDMVSLFAYSQTGSGFSAAYLQIWDGDPRDASSSIIFGDLSTNRFTGSTFTDTYRISNTVVQPILTPIGTSRPIFELAVGVGGVVLQPGTYWLDWQTRAADGGGHWNPPVTVVDHRALPGWNAMQFSTPSGVGFWDPVMDPGNPRSVAPDLPQDLPFIIHGVPEPASLSLLVIGTLASARRRSPLRRHTAGLPPRSIP